LAELFWYSDNDMLRSWSARNGSNGARAGTPASVAAAPAAFAAAKTPTPHAFPLHPRPGQLDAEAKSSGREKGHGRDTQVTCPRRHMNWSMQNLVPDRTNTFAFVGGVSRLVRVDPGTPGHQRAVMGVPLAQLSPSEDAIVSPKG